MLSSSLIYQTQALESQQEIINQKTQMIEQVFVYHVSDFVVLMLMLVFVSMHITFASLKCEYLTLL